MERLELTRHRPKNPPSKTVSEAERIKGKVVNSNRKKERNMTRTRTTQEIGEIRATMAMPTAERVARLEAAINDLDRQAALTNSGTEAMRLSGARLLDEEALRLTETGADYGSALRQAAGVVDVSDPADAEDGPHRRLGDAHHGSDEELEKIVNERMNGDKENYA